MKPGVVQGIFTLFTAATQIRQRTTTTKIIVIGVEKKMRSSRRLLRIRATPNNDHNGVVIPDTTSSSSSSNSMDTTTTTKNETTTVLDDVDRIIGGGVVVEEAIQTTSSSSSFRFWGDSPLMGNNNNNNKATSLSSIAWLNVVPIIWGTQHAVIKMVVSDSSDTAAPFTLLRFGLAALLASPYLFPGGGLSSSLSSSSSLFPNNNPPNPTTSENNHNTTTTTAMERRRIHSKSLLPWRWGVEMGVWMFLGFAFQAVGLATTTAQRSGFLLYLNVKLVPFFAKLLYGRSISVGTWVSAFLAFSGTALLTLDRSMGNGLFHWNEGDLWTVAAAASSAMFILRLETASTKVPDSAQLNAICLLVVACLATIWTFMAAATGLDPTNHESSSSFTVVVSELGRLGMAHPIELLYLGGVATALANFIQAKGQKEVSAERASIIYSLDPVYGAFFSWALLGETLGGAPAFVGAGLITVAAVTNAFLDFGTKKEEESKKMDE